MENLTLEATKKELLAHYEELLSKVSMDESYVKKTAKNTKQEIFGEITLVSKLVPVEPTVADPFPNIEKEVKNALDSLILAGKELGSFIDHKEKPDRRDRFVHKAIEDIEDAIHNIHMREGRKLKDDD